MSGTRRRGLLGFLVAGLGLAVGLWAAAPKPQPARPATAPNEQRLQEAVQLAAAALADMEDGNFGRAEAALREVGKILPDNALPPINLAICYFRLDRRQDALREIERARRLAPDNPQSLYTLARILEPQVAADRDVRARFEETLERLARLDPRDPRPFYLRAQALAQGDRPQEALAMLREAVRRAPDNLTLLVEQLATAALAGDADAASDAVDALEDRLNGFDPPADGYAETLRERAAAGGAELRPPALVLQNILRPTDLYRIGLAELEGRDSGLALFPQLEFEPPLPKSVQGGQDIEITWRDDTAEVFGALNAAAVRDLVVERRPGSEDLLLFVEAPNGRRTIVRFGAAAATAHATGTEVAAGAASGYDFDQDGRVDLTVAARDGVELYRGLDGGGFGAGQRIFEGGGGRALFPIEIDHDGDLDLFVARDGAADVYLQNRGGSGFSDRTGELGIGGDADATTGLASADFDDDGDLDLVIGYRNRGLRFFDNRRAGSFQDRTEVAGLAQSAPADGVFAADYDHDGRFDLLAWRAGTAPRWWRNTGSGFEPGAPIGGGDRSLAATVASPADFDNDGDLDVVWVAPDRRLVLARNRRDVADTAQASRFAIEDTGLVLPAIAVQLVVGDFDGDGDLDLVARLADGGARFLRNQGGDKNQWLRLSLEGLYDNNSKNNTQGLFTKIETRSGGAYQATIGNGGINHIGLGARRQADVVRVVWTNGLAQTWQQLAARQTRIEKQVLKGSCPFLYTWNGERFVFHTDLMWRSTLGMIFADGSPAPHQSARDWVLVPGTALRPSAGELWLQVTNELWETIYVDRQSLLVVDHPQDLVPVVDETFGPPPFPTEPPLYFWRELRAPDNARDHRGHDVLAEMRNRDGQHVGNLPLSRYQGITTGQTLELSFDRPPRDQDLTLVLWGWIFPSDTSINFAVAQDQALSPSPPRLEVRGGDGDWRTLRESIGVPMGKRKAMVVPLSGVDEHDLVGGSLALRISTGLQIYWDAAALAVGASRSEEVRISRLELSSAELHYRGFSRLYRDSDSAPHLFDYDTVETRSPFRPMTGRYTGYGDVADLVTAEDDRLVVMSPGDEMTVRYPATGLPPLPAGFSRSYVLYTDGWVKDADLHTVASQTVEPMPRHGMPGYPDPDGTVANPVADWKRTRLVNDRNFVEALRPPR